MCVGRLVGGGRGAPLQLGVTSWVPRLRVLWPTNRFISPKSLTKATDSSVMLILVVEAEACFKTLLAEATKSSYLMIQASLYPYPTLILSTLDLIASTNASSRSSNCLTCTYFAFLISAGIR